MDKLTLADQQKDRKMSDERLRAKLIEAVYGKDDMDLTDREELLALYADFLVQTQTRVSVSEPPALPRVKTTHLLAGLVVIQI